MISQPSITTQRICWLIWLYFFLLIFEGALRKWVLPQLSAPLLIVRDPILIAIYLLAIYKRLFPWNPFVLTLFFLAGASFGCSLFIENSSLGVSLYGLRTTFLHVPLIFIMSSTLDRSTIEAIGYWTLRLLIPISILMLLQYMSPPSAWINTIPGGTGFQIDAPGHRVRPPGPFSFITGVSEFFGLASAFLLLGILRLRLYPKTLLSFSLAALILGCSVSISRLTLSSVAIVIWAFCILAALRPGLTSKLMAIAIAGSVMFLLFAQLQVVHQAMGTFEDRITLASKFEGGFGGFIDRIFLIFAEPFFNIDQIPLTGFGLGVGTNVGATLLIGKQIFLLSEGEWSRMVMEGGPILGFGMVFWRVFLFIYLLWNSLMLALKGYAEPLLFFSASCTLLLFGQWGRPTTLGFTIFITGLCYTSIQFILREIHERERHVAAIH